MHVRMRAPTFPRGRLDWAGALRRRGAHTRAHDLASSAAAEIHGLGAAPLERRAEALLAGGEPVARGGV
jgi:hypothetical protein